MVNPIKNTELPKAKSAPKASITESTERRRPVSGTHHFDDRKEKFKEALNKNGQQVSNKSNDKQESDQVDDEAPVSSLFTLASQTKQASELDQLPQEMAKMHLSFAELQKMEGEMDEVDLASDDDEDSEMGVKMQEGDVSRFATSPYSVRPVSQVNMRLASVDQTEKTTATKKLLLQLADELAASMKVMQAQDRTETSITLKHPPIFSGVSLIVTEFQSAKKDFNLTFFNLTNPEARALIEMKQNQEALRMALNDRGYNLQMITIEPKMEVKVSQLAEGQSLSHNQDKNREEKDFTEKKKK